MAKIDPIDRAALLEKFREAGMGEHSLIERVFADGVYAVIENAPTLDVQPARRGEWRVTEAWPHRVYCSNCYTTIGQSNVPGDVEAKCVPRTNFCHECGADMRGERLDGDDT